MARPVEFDRTHALQSALMLFWSRGYQAASLTDLTEAMGISRSSFYATFGDKRGLFLACLDQFAARSVGILTEARTRHPPLEALRTFFGHGFAASVDDRSTWGCLLVNTVLEMADVDEAICNHARLRLADVEAAIKACLSETGCRPEKADELSSFLMLVNEGLRVSSRRALPEMAQRQQIDTTFRLLATALA